MLTKIQLNMINDILHANRIPWRVYEGESAEWSSDAFFPDFNREVRLKYEDEELLYDKSTWRMKDDLDGRTRYKGKLHEKMYKEYVYSVSELFDKLGLHIGGTSGINVFPSNGMGPLYDNFLGICGLESGNNSLITVFREMSEWGKAHVTTIREHRYYDIPERNYNSDKELTAVIITDKWNSNSYENYCKTFEDLNVRLVIILMADIPMEIPYTYVNFAVRTLINRFNMNEDQASVIKHVYRIMTRDLYIKSVYDIERYDKGIAELARSNFGSDCDEIVRSLQSVLIENSKFY